VDYSDAATRRPVPLAMMWRQQHDDTDVPIPRTLPVGEPNAPGPAEQHDLSQFATTENHAAKVGAFKYARSTISTHAATVRLRPGRQTGLIAEGDVVQLYLQVVTSREPPSVINRVYVVESIGYSLAGEETLSLSHFPVNSSGQSLIALAVANATGPGEILPSNRSGSSCDIPGASTDTTVPAKTTGGIAFRVSPPVNPFPGGPPSDSPPAPPPAEGPPTPTRNRTAGGRSIIPPTDGVNSAGGTELCPNGYAQINGYVDGGRVVSGVGICGGTGRSFSATSFPNFSYIGNYTIGSAWRIETWRVRWVDLNDGPQDIEVSSVISLIDAVPFNCPFTIAATSYSCRLDDGSAGPTLSFPS
jgi:hypothetical protein